MPTASRSIVVLSVSTMAFALSAAVLTLTPGCKTNPSTGRSQLILLSSNEVASMGHEARPQLTAEYGGEVPSAQLRDYVSGVGRRLAKHVEPEFKDVEWTFTTLNSDVINAFALPGGHVFMSKGLLVKMEDEAELAGVLGHEIGHVTGRHVDERLSQTLAAQFGVAAVGIASGSELITAGTQMLAQGSLLKFNRDQEAEADRQGLKYMVKAGYDPAGLKGVMAILIEASKGASQPEFLSTHPDPARRLRDVTALIEKDYQNTQNNPEYQRFKGRFQREVGPHIAAHAAEQRAMIALGLVDETPARRGVGDPALWCAICRAERAVGSQPSAIGNGSMEAAAANQ